MKIHHKIIFVACCYLLLVNVALGQNSCESFAGTASFLDTKRINARISNNGTLFGPSYPSGPYYIPKQEGSISLYNGVFFVIGIIEDEIRFTDMPDSGGSGFQPGPLDKNGEPTIDCAPYDKVWKIEKQDIQDYLDHGDISSNLTEWPWQFGAPVVDGDGIPNNYNLQNGDLPELLGDQRLWWIMNDKRDTTNRSSIKPIGFEVHGSVHAFDHPSVIGNISFYHYQLILKNDKPLIDAYVNFTSWADLGWFDDNYAGSDSTLHLSYAYNADDFDEGENAYGKSPPAIGVTFFQTIDIPSDGLDNDRDGVIDEIGEKLGATSVIEGVAGRDLGNPADLYNAVQGKIYDGNPMLEGFWGFDFRQWPTDFPKKPTKFLFSGDPVTRSFWSEMNIDGQGTLGITNAGTSTSLYLSSGPFSMAPMDTIDVKFAIVWSRGTNHLDSVTELKKDVAHVRNEQAAFYTPSKISANLPESVPRSVLGFKQNYPNPFSASTNLSYSLPKPMQVKLAVYDILGREVKLLVDAHQEAGIYNLKFDAGNLPAGVYLARIELDHLRFTKRMLLVR